MTSPDATLLWRLRELLALPEPRREDHLRSLPLDTANRLRTLITYESVDDDWLDRPPSRSDGPPPAGTRAIRGALDEYRVGRLIARGGSSEVRECWDSRGIRLALKTLDSGNESAAEMYAREENALRRLGHLRVARLVDHGNDPDGAPFLVMELVDGPTLTEFARLHACPAEERFGLWLELCETVAAIHDTGLVHRDLKPANVRVRSGHPIVLDFGVAADLGDPHAAVGAFTPGFAAPEQVSGAAATPRADVYALGVLGHHLFFDRGPEHDAQHGLRDKLRDVGLDRVGDVLALCLALDPEARYPTARELLADLRRARRGRNTRARYDLRMQAARRWRQRHRGPVLLGVGLCATLGVIALDQSWHAQRDAATESVRIAQTEHERAADAARSMVSLLVRAEANAHSDPETSAQAIARVERLHRQMEARDHGSALERLIQASAIAQLYGQAGAYDRAAEVVREMIRAAAVCPTISADTRQKYRFMLAMHLGMAGQYAEAEDRLRALLREFETHRQLAPARAAQTHWALAGILRTRGEFEGAQRLLDQAAARHQGLQARHTRHLGALALERGDFDRARALLEMSSTTVASAPAADAHVVGDLSVRLARVAWLQDRDIEAARLVREARIAMAAAGSSGRDVRVMAELVASDIATTRGDLAQALSAAQEAWRWGATLPPAAIDHGRGYAGWLRAKALATGPESVTRPEVRTLIGFQAAATIGSPVRARLDAELALIRGAQGLVQESERLGTAAIATGGAEGARASRMLDALTASHHRPGSQARLDGG